MLRVLMPLLLLLSACAGQGPAPLPLPSRPQAEPTLTLSTLLSEPQRWSGRPITLIAPARLSDGQRVLTPQLGLSDGAEHSSLWLAEAPPATIINRLPDGAGYLKLRGRLSPPGAFGRDQRYTYQFVADELAVLEPERTTVANLADNPLAIDGVLLAVDGTLLVRDDSALLVDRVSAGGVPETDARQIKLPRAAIDAATVAGFERSGDVRWGPVRVTGWWQDGAMALFAIEPEDS